MNARTSREAGGVRFPVFFVVIAACFLAALTLASAHRIFRVDDGRSVGGAVVPVDASAPAAKQTLQPDSIPAPVRKAPVRTPKVAAGGSVSDASSSDGLKASRIQGDPTTTALPGAEFATVSNSAPITINDTSSATPYPSNITVSGIPGVVSSVTVTLNGLSHIYGRDIDILLVGPGGRKAIIMSDVGGDFTVSGLSLTLSDSALSGLPPSTTLVSGTFKPTNFNDDNEFDSFPLFATPPTTNTLLSSFNGAVANGTWSLYVVDDLGGGAGSISGGWSLTIATACVVPPPNMVAWWRLDESSGTLARDSAGVNPGTISAGATPIPGEVNNALSFNGTTGQVDVLDHPSLNFGTGNFSVDFWVRTTTVSASVSVILDKRDSGTETGYHVYLYQGRLGFQLSGTNYDSTKLIATGQWVHGAITVDRVTNGLKFWVDGSNVASYTPIAASITNTSHLYLGQRYDGGGRFTGDLDEVEVFNRALTTSEVRNLHAAGAAGKCKYVPAVCNNDACAGGPSPYNFFLALPIGSPIKNETQLFQSIPNCVSVSKFNKATDLFGPTWDGTTCSGTPETGCEPCFCVNPGEGVRVRVSAASSFDILGVDGSMTIPLLQPGGGISNTGNNLVALPFCSPTVTSASQLMNSIGFNNVISIAKFLCATDTFTTYTGRKGSAPDFALISGVSYFVKMLTTVNYVTQYSPTCTATACTNCGPDGSFCDAGNACTWPDICASGVCTTGSPKACDDSDACTDDSCDSVTGCTHTTTNCDDGNPCTTDTCSPGSGCQHTNNTASCNDGLFCDGADTCSGGSCIHAGDPCAGGAVCNNNACNEAADNCFSGSAVTCATDNNVCTDDHCNGSGACVHTNNTAACDDSNACTYNDVCNAGACGGTSITCTSDQCNTRACNGTSTCTVTPLTGPVCDDGSVCTSGETCRAGTCMPPVSFAQAVGSPVAAGSLPISVAVGDLNRDGRLDLAVVDFGTDKVMVLLGNGSGGFSPAAGSPFSVGGSSPYSVSIGDLNGDGNLDLAVPNQNSGNVSILLGTGSGGFAPAAGSPVAVGGLPRSVAIGKLNADGIPDLAVANAASNNVRILLGTGSGGFTLPGSTFATGTGSESVAAGYLDGGTNLDLAVVNAGSSNVTILLGNGSGGFTLPASTFGTGSSPFSVAVGDLNGDLISDLAISNTSSNNVTILLGNGSGGFAQAAGSPIPVGSQPDSLTIGDLNGDGKLDVVSANRGSSNVTLLLGNGSGGFTQAVGSPIAVGTHPESVAVGDFDSDGKLDIVAANFDSNTVTILLNTSTFLGCSDGNPCTADSCNSVSGCQHPVGNPGAICRASAGQCDVPESCTGASATCPTDGFASSGTGCAGTSQGGVCDGTDHCSGSANTCVDGFVPSGTQCRSSAGTCDVAENCAGSSGTCPGDVFQPNTTTCTGTSQGGLCDKTDHCSGTANTCVDEYQASTFTCRGSAGTCDVAENCTGSSGTCPGNVFQPNTTTCTGTSQGGLCDKTDHCSGTANTCVDEYQAPTFACRASAGTCDVAENCTGSSGTCPGDVFQPNTTTCTGTSQGGLCDKTDHCSGTANTCVDEYQAPTFTCRASAGTCDVADNCSGSSGGCTNVFASSATSCTGASQGGLCDGADHCSGSANTCVDEFLPVSTVCRGSAGQCDAVEVCSGSSGTCPSDASQQNGFPCNDGLFCNGADGCNLGACTTHAGNPCPGPDGDGNCAETCDETLDTCNANDPNGTPCTDGNVCTPGDQCLNGTCVSGTFPPIEVCDGLDNDNDGTVDNISQPWTGEADQTSAFMGSAVATGNINADCYDDVVIGAPNYGSGTGRPGRAYFYTGSTTGALTLLATKDSTFPSSGFGTAVAMAKSGNVVAVVGAPLYDEAAGADAGRVYVYFGSALSTSQFLSGVQAGAQFGAAVAVADVNGDGLNDVIVGAPNFANGQTKEGAVYVYLGLTATSVSSTASIRIESNEANAILGTSVARAGRLADVASDSYDDVIVGAPGHSANRGAAYVYYGGTPVTGLPASASWTVEGPAGTTKFGTQVASAGDVSNNGFMGVMASAPNYSSPEVNEGAVFGWYGSSTGMGASLRAANWRIEGNVASAGGGGMAIAAAGTCGPYANIAIGARTYTNTLAGQGRVSVYPGSITGPPIAPSWVADGDQGSGSFGSAVAAGDVNGDGIADLVVGASLYDNGQADEGRAHVLLGSSTCKWAWGSRWYRDADGDGHGDPAVSTIACSPPPPGYVALSDDCDDTDAARFPGNPEICDGKDNDCHCASDSCRDNQQNCVDEELCHVPEQCNHADDNCNGLVDEDFQVGLACNTGEPGVCGPGTYFCSTTGGIECIGQGQGPAEICNGLDDDCDGFVDENSDGDQDGVGDCLDNCPGTYNPTQANADSDPFGDACDCDPASAANTSPPELSPKGSLSGSISPRRIDKLPNGTVKFEIEGGGSFHLFRGYKTGGLSWAIPYDHFGAGEVNGSPGPTTILQDTLVPRVNTLFFYLISPVNGCGEAVQGREGRNNHSNVYQILPAGQLFSPASVAWTIKANPPGALPDPVCSGSVDGTDPATMVANFKTAVTGACGGLVTATNGTTSTEFRVTINDLSRGAPRIFIAGTEVSTERPGVALGTMTILLRIGDPITSQPGYGQLPITEDHDGDGFSDPTDNCPTIRACPYRPECDGNPSCPCPVDSDVDQDGIGDACDNCPAPGFANPGQDDNDADGLGDICDPDDDNDGFDDAGGVGPCMVGPPNCNVATNCRDNCPFTANNDQSDLDCDGVGDACDNCPAVSNPGQENSDFDKEGDICDLDDDNDGVLDAGGAGPCMVGPSCNVTSNCHDNCRFTINPNQEDGDCDGVGNGCDNCPAIANTAQGDCDNDHVGDACDTDCTICTDGVCPH